MDNERIAGRTPFNLVDPLHGLCIEGVCGEAVNGFGRQRDKPASLDQLRGARDSGMVGCQSLGAALVAHRRAL